MIPSGAARDRREARDVSTITELLKSWPRILSQSSASLYSSSGAGEGLGRKGEGGGAVLLWMWRKLKPILST